MIATGKEKEAIEALGKAYAERGYVVVSASKPLRVGIIIKLTKEIYEGLPALRVMAETDRADAEGQVAITAAGGYPRNPIRADQRYFYRCEGD